MTTELPPSILSRPVYGRLSARPGAAHLFVCDGPGAGAVAAILGALQGEAVQVICLPGPDGVEQSAVLEGYTGVRVFRAPSLAAALPRLRKVLGDAHMGMQVHVAGTEGVIGQVVAEAMAAGLPFAAVQTEHRGSTVRRVQCVHCKGITENVATDPFECSHCGLHLFVRDHYSRRIAAFQGVNIDAENPGRVPPMQERFR